MRRNYSRMESVEERKNTKKAVVFVLSSILIIVFLAVFGLPLITRIIGFTTSFKKSSQTGELIDKTPPSPPFIQTIPDAINSSPFKITGRVEPGNTVIVNFNEISDEIQADEQGSFSSTFQLTKGENIFYAYSKDPAGNPSQETKKYTIIFDNEIPEINILSPDDGTNFYGSKQKNVTVKGTTEIDSSITVNDRIATVNDNGEFSLNYSLSNGENILIIKSVDKAGNEKEISLKLFFSE